MGSKSIFERYEKKYLLNEEQYKDILAAASPYLLKDEYGKYTIFNIYFDTPDFQLIRASLEKPIYKEKLRLRSYGVPSADTTVFVELKKKYKGVVYKRRAAMTYKQSYYYLMKNRLPYEDNQILKEIDWFRAFYNPQPAVNLSYEREAYKGLDDETLRITFDANILWRRRNLDLTNGAYGSAVLEDGARLMEIKTSGAMPLWLCRALNETEAFPTSFSKYGACYTQMLAEQTAKKGVIYCA